MQTNFQIEKTQLSKVAAETYGTRLARRIMLKKYCQDGHAVLEIENQLIDMAAARLIEAMIMSSSNYEDISRTVRNAAATHVMASDEDEQVKKLAMYDIIHMTDEEILPRLN